MEHDQLLEVVLKVGQETGMVTVCDEPTVAQRRTHMLSLLLFAAFFLVPFLLG